GRPRLRRRARPPRGRYRAPARGVIGALRDAATASAVFGVVFLVVLLGDVEGAGERDLGGDGREIFAVALEPGGGGTGDGFLVRRGEKNGRAVLPADVGAVALFGRWIVHFPKGLQQCGEADLCGIVFHLDHFGVAGFV